VSDPEIESRYEFLGPDVRLEWVPLGLRSRDVSSPWYVAIYRRRDLPPEASPERIRRAFARLDGAPLSKEMRRMLESLPEGAS
jgi:hypothetical protein